MSVDSQHPWQCRLLDRQAVCLIGLPRAGSSPFDLRCTCSRRALIVPGRSSDVRSQFEVYCHSHGLSPIIFSEVDDMAMLRLLARDLATWPCCRPWWCRTDAQRRPVASAACWTASSSSSR